MTEQPFEFADDRLRRVHEGLLLIGPGPAAFFLDACRLMADDRGLDSVAHLIGHLLREIEGALLDVLYSLSPDVTGGASSNAAEESRSEARIQHTKKVNQALTALGVKLEDPLAEAWRQLPDQINLTRWAHRRGLRSPRTAGPDLEEAWQSVVRIFDFLLDRFRARYAVAVALVDNQLRIDHPTAADARFLRDSAPHNPSLLSYFFSQCNNPHWLKPLHQAGFFEAADAATGWVAWPQSEYLARVASAVPEEVVAVLEDLPSKVSEPVLENLAKATVAMPKALAGRAAAKLTKLLTQMDHLDTGQQVAELIVHLAETGDTSAALQLAETLFDAVPAPPERQEAGLQAGLGPAEPLTRLEEWAFRERFGRVLPILAERAGVAFVASLAAVLDRCIALQYPAATHEPVDLSSIWRPLIEDHGQNLPFGTGSLLAGATRAATEQVVAKNPALLQPVIEALRQHNWNIFTRLVLHLIRVTEPRDPSLLAHYLADRRMFDNPSVEHEYAMLLGAGFASLGETEQELILSWIEAGPDPSDFISFIRHQAARDATDEEVAAERSRWQLERLSWIKDVLPQRWRQTRASLVARLGEPAHPTFPSWHSSFRGPVSPKSEADLASMTIEELSTFLRTWKPSGDHWSPTPEGLGRALSIVVQKHAQELSANASNFAGLDATYLSAFFAGIRDAAKEGAAPSWSNMLDLAFWAVSQPREIPDREPHGFDQDPHWGWCRRRIGDLLSVGLQRGSAELPYEHRALVWSVLERLMADPDPSPADEEGRHMGYATIAINSVRGVALAAVCQYCLWVRRHLETLSEPEARLARGFAGLPEARALLDRHLDQLVDPSLAIRAVFGQHFPWLHLIDPEWAKLKAPVIFPAAESYRDCWRAAWDTYVTFCHPYDAMLGVLGPQYHLAIDRIGGSEDADHVGHPDLKLGEHLLAFYCRGRISLDSEDGLLGHFFAAGTPEIRGAVLGNLGWALHREPPQEPCDQLRGRLKHLWEWRAARDLAPPEAAAFGWWFASAFFDPDWSLGHLERALRVANNVKSDYFVAGQLAKIAALRPSECLRCMELLVSGKEAFHLYGWRKEIAAVVSAARHSGSPDVCRLAEELVNRLVSQGLIDFRDMLSDETKQE